jgi:enamine deaminase RidA (YjgF/YER057c/UK114 family)
MFRLRSIAVSSLLLAFAGPVPAQSYDPEARLRELGLTLPSPSAPVANYVPVVRVGNLLYLAGHGECGDAYMTGKAGRDVTTDSAYAAARRTGLCLLSTLKAELGDLRKVRRIVKVLGMVNATPEFTDHPRVINGCSDLLVQVFGDRGRHARSAAGMASLPFNVTVEIEMVVEIEDGERLAMSRNHHHPHSGDAHAAH